jgi:DNA-binding transcriptional LysR family regulator
MPQENFNDLAAFAVIARERSFTRAAAKLGVTQSALSQMMRGLEARLGLRLLVRTTRSISPTEAGQMLLQTVGPRFEEIEAGLAALNELRDEPSGTIRITAGEHPAIAILQPKLAKLLRQYPDVHVELIVDNGLTDIAAEGYDAGVRLGERVAKDMIAVRISANFRMAVVGSMAYFATRSPPQTPQDLVEHDCINMRLPTYDGLVPWTFSKGGKDLNVRVEGRVVLNNIVLRLNSVLDGLGLAYLPEDQVHTYIESGLLIRVLEDWCPSFPGYHLYYPNRRHLSRAFLLLLDALRYSEA